jgi:hypothetical protein
MRGITYPRKRTINWSGTRQVSLSGKKTRTSFQSYPTYSYEIPFSFLRSDAANLEWQTFTGFINSLQVGSGLFLYSDPDDNSANAQNFGDGDGVTTTFQLVRTLGGFTEPVFFPVQPIPTVAVAGVPTAAYTVSPIGQIIFDAPPANATALTWTGAFYWGCRLDDDAIDFDKFMTTIYELKAFKFSTEKLP